MSNNPIPTFVSDLFRPSPTVDDFGHVCWYQETFERVRPLLRRVPITRIFDATPLDRIGVPVWSAVTPLGRDLTVHAGKGRTHLAAKLSAIMEAIERVSAESVAEHRIMRASWRDLQISRVEAIAPDDLDLPYETSYAADREIGWVQGYDLLAGSTAFVPLDLVLSPPSEGVAVGVETNGLAAGNSFTEAVVHALYEVIERDAVSHEEFLRRYGDTAARLRNPVRAIDLRTLPPAALDLLAILAPTMRVHVQQLTHPTTAVHVFAAILEDRDFPGLEEPVSFAGYGADLHPSRAVMRALLETFQGHTIVTVGARDAYEGTRPIPDRAGTLLRRLDLLNPVHVVPFPELPVSSPVDLARDLQDLLSRLQRGGFSRCVVVDLTDSALGIPVVRVLVPGMAAPYGATTRRPNLRLLRNIL